MRGATGRGREIVIHGNRRIPAETIRARMFTRPGDVYDQAALERDFNSLWNTGYFDDLRIEREPSAKGWIIHVYVKEKPTIREIKYVGLSSVSQSDVLDKFKERKVGLTQESQYDPTKVKRAEVVHQGIAGRARPPVRHRPLGSAPHPSRRRRPDLRGEGRPQGEGRKDHL